MSGGSPHVFRWPALRSRSSIKRRHRSCHRSQTTATIKISVSSYLVTLRGLVIVAPLISRPWPKGTSKDSKDGTIITGARAVSASPLQ